MLRNLLMWIGFIVAILPYLGIPYDVTKWIWTILGLFIVFVLFFSQKGKLHYIPYSLEEETSPLLDLRELSVSHDEKVEHPEMHIEKEVVTEIPHNTHTSHEVKIEEMKVTTTFHRKRKKVAHPTEAPAETIVEGV